MIKTIDPLGVFKITDKWSEKDFDLELGYNGQSPESIF